MNGLFLLLATLTGVTPEIKVIYPRLAQGDSLIRIARVDSNFVFGSVSPVDTKLRLNGRLIEVEAGGGFIGFTAVDWERKTFELTASHEGDSVEFSLYFDAPLPGVEPPPPAFATPKFITILGGFARTAVDGAYYLFPDSGTVVRADAWQAGYYQVRIGAGRTVWIPDVNTRDTDIGWTAPQVVWKGNARAEDRWEILRLPLARKTLYRIWDEGDNRTVVAEFYGVTAHIDRISHDPALRQISGITWDQPEDGTLRLTISLKAVCWGYRVKWTDDGVEIGIRRPPPKGRGVRGLKIAIDPGHGGEQSGAIGPTGLLEKQANLEAAVALGELLKRRGAEVIMTRYADVALGLNERIRIAGEQGADLLISLHHNALPDGVNPFGARGVGARYYLPQGRMLAQRIQEEVVAELGLPDEGFYYDNLALTRPTWVPSVLLEAAYIMLPDQEAMMREPDYSKRLAKATYRGILNFARENRDVEWWMGMFNR